MLTRPCDFKFSTPLKPTCSNLVLQEYKLFFLLKLKNRMCVPLRAASLRQYKFKQVPTIFALQKQENYKKKRNCLKLLILKTSEDLNYQVRHEISLKEICEKVKNVCHFFVIMNGYTCKSFKNIMIFKPRAMRRKNGLYASLLYR